MNKPRRSAYARKPRKDKGSTHQVHVDYGYFTQLRRASGAGVRCKLTEAQYKGLVAHGCCLCGDEAQRLYRPSMCVLDASAKPYCDTCYSAVKSLKTEAELAAYATRLVEKWGI